MDLEKLLNPPIVVENIKYNNNTYKLIQDTYLLSGSKQRGYTYFKKLKESGIDIIISVASSHGYGQFALSYCCHLLNLKCYLFIQKHPIRTDITNDAMKYNKHIIEVKNKNNKYVSMKDLFDKATLLEQKLIKQNKNVKLLKLGLDNEEYIQDFSFNIKNAFKYDIQPKRIWVAAGSATLARTLSKAFPNAIILLVQVGKTIWPDLLEGMNHKLYISKTSFLQNAKILPPYTSLSNYDAKIWEFVIKFGENGDFIWNVK